MPQLDRYLVFSETFWFVLCFTLAYILVAHLLIRLIRGLRLRSAVIADELLVSFDLKFEKVTLAAAPYLDRSLVGLTPRLDFWLNLLEWRLNSQASNEIIFEELNIETMQDSFQPWFRSLVDLELLDTGFNKNIS